MNQLPSVLRNEIWEYVRGDRKYWKSQFSDTIFQLERRGSYFPDVRLKQAFIESAVADVEGEDCICPFCGMFCMSEANGQGYWECDHCDQIAAYCVKCQGWMNFVDFADIRRNEKERNKVERRMPRSSSTKLATDDRPQMETTAILCWKCEKCSHVEITTHW